MKKLMFTAAVAAMTAGAFAGEVQVYDMTINVKTTECKKNSSAITDACGNTFTYYRTQASAKFEGKFWGCECDVIACPVADDYGKDEADLNSYMFWGKNAAFHNVAFTWDLLQLVGKKTTNIEGVWSADFFLCEDGVVATDPTASLTGAGYGTAKIVGCADALNQISSMSGNLVGIYDVVDGAGVVGCPYCGDVVACAPYQFCDCVDVRENESAAYGTWTLKFNSTIANKIAKGKFITEAYSFKKFVLAEMACIAEEADPEPVEPTPAEKLAKQLATAKAAVVAASNTVQKTEAELIELTCALYGHSTPAMKNAEKALDDYMTEIKVSNLTDWYDQSGDKVREILDDAGVGNPAREAIILAMKDYGTKLETQMAAKDALADVKAEYAHGYDLNGNRVREADVKAAETALTDAKYDTADSLKALKATIAKSEYALATKTQVKLTEVLNTFNAQAEVFDTLLTAQNDAEIARDEVKYDYVNEDHVWDYTAHNKAQEAAEKAGDDAKSALRTAENELATIQAACLVATGSKDCQ